jgi:nucleotide-binding universal stress UspA family protein
LALDRAVLLAENNQAELTVVEVIPRLSPWISLTLTGPTSEEIQIAGTQEHARRLESLVTPHASRCPVEVKILTGTPYLEIVRQVLRGGHDLVIRPPRIQVRSADCSAVTT